MGIGDAVAVGNTPTAPPAAAADVTVAAVGAAEGLAGYLCC